MNQQIGTVFELKGGLALSDFRAARALASLRKVSPLVEAVSGRFVHFVHAERALTDDERARLEALLTYGDPAVTVREDLAFMVVPRLGTIRSRPAAGTVDDTMILRNASHLWYHRSDQPGGTCHGRNRPRPLTARDRSPDPGPPAENE